MNQLPQEINVPRETLDKLNTLETILLKWQKAFNLISPSTIGNIWDRHILDSLQLIPHIKNKEIKILDLGSGGGMPGAVLAICGYEVTCVDSNGKKCQFLKNVSRETLSRLSIINKRVENLSPEEAKCDIITARGFASLEKIFELTAQNATNKTRFLLHKGEDWQKEIAVAERKWVFLYKNHASLTSENSVILDIVNVEKRG